MSVSGELLCSFELLKPLDSSALKSHIKKGRNKRNSILNSPVSGVIWRKESVEVLTNTLARQSFGSKLLTKVIRKNLNGKHYDAFSSQTEDGSRLSRARLGEVATWLVYSLYPYYIST